MRALLFANGELPSRVLIEALRAEADIVVAADGGVDKALASGVKVDVVVGDLDSSSPEARASLPGNALRPSGDADSTDLQKAVAFCIERGCDVIDIVAAGGGRADHALANLSVLTMFGRQATIRIVDDLFNVELVVGVAAIEAEPGTVVSLVAIGPCTGISTTGLRWNLTDAALTFSPRGVHNEVASRPATVSVDQGDLLLFRGRWVERHG